MLKLVSRVFLGLLLIVIGGAIGFTVAKLLRADDHATVTTVYEDWRLTCPPVGQQSCHADEELVDVRTGAAMARISIVGRPGERDATITLPHNLLIPPGIALKVGNDAAQVFPYDYCDRIGCIVPIRIAADGESKLRHAEHGSITVVDSQNKLAVIPFSLQGIGDALDALDRAESARAHWWQKILS